MRDDPPRGAGDRDVVSRGFRRRAVVTFDSATGATRGRGRCHLGVLPMFSIYLAFALFGGVLLAASLLSGDGDHDHDHGDGADHLDHLHDHHPARLPFLSMRFWAFSTAFFGVAGAALELAGGLGWLTTVVAVVVGLACGLVATRVLGQLRRDTVGLLGDASAHLGRECLVLLPVAPGRRGKIRLSVSGVSTDLIAETDGSQLAAGDSAWVVGLRGTVALVERDPVAPKRPTPAPAADDKTERGKP